MSEEEMNNMFEESEVVKRASQNPPLGMVDGDKERAKALWIVIQICAWLRHSTGSKYPRIKKINTWNDQKTSIDIFVGLNGKYGYFKLVTNRAADDLLMLRIAEPNEKGASSLDGKSFETVWDAYGVEIKDDESDSMFIETLPKGKKPGKKHFFRQH